ncbi:hypothetical protein AKJ09_07011 [Labilithrix luteola]|uniref:Uncharacterized protein n=2 Tax=Labilithrix luteola TaxID=1391654 RepID=A0A0K1Q3M2_9BACT|nr:hypothetical protein AKJ09_07011 [Labilithrix luteola]
MPTDLLLLAANASEILERHGLVACGRRQDGVTRVDFRTRDGSSYQHELRRDDLTVDEVVAECLVIAGLVKTAGGRRPSELN